MDALDVYADDELAALYDLVYGDTEDDFSLYEQFAHRGGSSSLELCAGSGRVTLHLAKRGLPVVAIDGARAMLARLESRLDPGTQPLVRLVQSDMRHFSLLPETFDLIFCAFASFEQLLTTTDQLACLTTVAQHLAPGGLFVAELRSLPTIEWDAEPVLLYEWTRPDPATGDSITKLRSMSTAPSRQITIDTVIFDRTAPDGSVHRRQIEVAMRATGRFEMELLLERAGLRLADVYGDTALSPYTDESDSMIIVAELAKA